MSNEMKPRTNLEPARTILQQLGGSKFIAMTGAKHFLAGANTLSFRLPPHFAKRRINHVRVVLDENDTYSVFFGEAHGTRYTIVNEHQMVYADNLRTLFTEQTGLDTSLGLN
jgi:hypothetical protein